MATEKDNHAGIHCFGANFRPISLTLEEWTDSLFLLEYAEQKNVPICTGVTDLALDSGEVVILEFGKGSWFGNRMGKSLINPNQYQKFGTQICNDPTDTYRNLGIEASEDLFTPITIEGSTCGLVTNPPTDNELHEFQNILLSDEFDWDSSNIFLKFLQWRSIGKVQNFIDT